MQRFSLLIVFLLWPWVSNGSELAPKTAETEKTLQHLQMLVGQMIVTHNPIEQKKWANQVDSDLNQLKKDREELLALTGPHSPIGSNMNYQNLVSDLGVLQFNFHDWRPRSHWNMYWVDSKFVSSDLTGFDNLISQSLSDVRALT